MRLVCVPPNVLGVFRTTGLDDVFDVFPARDAVQQA
jgi:anti-anti-sigma regulatory factor